MKSLPIILSLALLSSVSVNAQSSKTMQHSTEHSCMMETTASEWKTIGLNADQLAKVEDIQARCKKECETAVSDKASAVDVSHKAITTKYTADVKGAMSAEQYNKWTAWCSGRSSKAKAEHEHMKE